MTKKKKETGVKKCKAMKTTTRKQLAQQSDEVVEAGEATEMVNLEAGEVTETTNMEAGEVTEMVNVEAAEMKKKKKKAIGVKKCKAMKTTTRKKLAQQSDEVVEAGQVTEMVNMEAGEVTVMINMEAGEVTEMVNMEAAEMTKKKKKKVTGVKKCKAMKTTARKKLAQQSDEVVEAGEVTEMINMEAGEVTKMVNMEAGEVTEMVNVEAGSEQNVGVDLVHVDDDIIVLSTATNYKSTRSSVPARSSRRSGGVLRKEFFMSKPFKLALTDDEQKLVKYVLSNPEDRDAHEICQFPEMKIRRFELHSLTPHKQLYSTIIDAFSHLLNREDIKKNGKITRFCFETNCADTVRGEDDNGEEVDESDDKQMKKLCINLDKLDYLQGVSWEACEYVFFPVHGGEQFAHYWAFAIDLKREKFLCLNSMECEERFNKELCYHDFGNRLMSHARSLIEAHTGKDISKFEWVVVPDAPVQPDLQSCGVFVINFMQHFDGSSFTSEQQQWGERKVIDDHRIRMIYRLVTSPDNTLLPEIVEAAEAWSQTLGSRGKAKRNTKKN
ncbi:hypothetical protein LINGRAHAP2_LOCUS25106 [Linum grandiflorum]